MCDSLRMSLTIVEAVKDYFSYRNVEHSVSTAVLAMVRLLSHIFLCGLFVQTGSVSAEFQLVSISQLSL